MGPIRRNSTGGELREHGAYECIWDWDEQRWAADFRNGRGHGIQEQLNTLDLVRDATK
jgi:hypothetical protein